MSSFPPADSINTNHDTLSQKTKSVDMAVAQSSDAQSPDTYEHIAKLPVEMLESVFLKLEEDDVDKQVPALLNIRRVSPHWMQVIDRSPQLLRRLFMKPALAHAGYTLPAQFHLYVCNEAGRISSHESFRGPWSGTYYKPISHRLNMLRSEVLPEICRPVELNPLIRRLAQATSTASSTADNPDDFLNDDSNKSVHVHKNQMNWARCDRLFPDGKLEVSLDITSSRATDMSSLLVPSVSDRLGSMLVAQPLSTRIECEVVLERVYIPVNVHGNTLRDLSNALQDAREVTQKHECGATLAWSIAFFYD